MTHDAEASNAGTEASLCAIDAMAEALISRLDHAGSLDNRGTRLAAYELRLAVAKAMGNDDARIEAAELSITELLVDACEASGVVITDDHCIWWEFGDQHSQRAGSSFKSIADAARDAIKVLALEV